MRGVRRRVGRRLTTGGLVVECPPGMYRLPGEPAGALDRQRTLSAGEKRAEALDRRRYERERAAFRGVWKLGDARAGPPRRMSPL
jgi:hypothetical protein